MNEFEEAKQKIISKLKSIVDEATFYMPPSAEQVLRDDMGFYIIKELENLTIDIANSKSQKMEKAISALCEALQELILQITLKEKII